MLNQEVKHFHSLDVFINDKIHFGGYEHKTFCGKYVTLSNRDVLPALIFT